MELVSHESNLVMEIEIALHGSGTGNADHGICFTRVKLCHGN